MLSSIGNFFRERRRGITIAVGVIGGAIFMGQYAANRFKEAHTRLLRHQNAKDNLLRRFQQNQEDCSLTVVALLSSLSKQIFDSLNVEAITEQIQQLTLNAKSSSSTTITTTTTPPPPSDSSSSSSSLEQSQSQPSPDSSVPQVHNSDHQTSPNGTDSNPASSNTQQSPQNQQNDQPNSENADLKLADSHSTPPQNDEKNHQNHNHHVDADAEQETEKEKEQIQPQLSKGELWNQIKILSFTRAISSIYLVSLLVLQTHVQLNLLGRYNYVSSVVEQMQNAQMDGPIQLVEDDEHKGINSFNERAYLTFTWWLLYKGWQNVKDRVQKAVETVLQPKQLKSKITAHEFNFIINSIRNQVEYESTGQFHSFATVLFPDNEEAEKEVLIQGGLPAAAQNFSPQLRNLLDETSDIIESPDFYLVQKACFDRLFQILLTSLNPAFTKTDLTSSQPQQQQQQQQPTLNGDSHPFVHPQLQRVTETNPSLNYTCQLASLFPLVTKEAQNILNGVPNEYVESCSSVRELTELSAVIYSGWEAKDILDSPFVNNSSSSS